MQRAVAEHGPFSDRAPERDSFVTVPSRSGCWCPATPTAHTEYSTVWMCQMCAVKAKAGDDAGRCGPEGRSPTI